MSYVISSGIVSTGIILTNDYMTILLGGTANNTAVNSGGYLYISGTANHTTLNDSGTIYVWNSGIANNTNVNSDCDFIVFSGGVANNTMVNSWGGWFYIYDGGIANSTTVNSGGYLLIFSGGTGNSTMVNSGGDYLVYSGGTATNTTVNSGGGIDVLSGGTASNITLSSGGYLTVNAGCSATGVVMQAGAGIYMAVAPDTYFQCTSGGRTVEMKNAVLSGFTVNTSAWIEVISGGTANNTTVNSDGRFYIYSGGIANNTTVNSGGYTLCSCGNVNGTIIEQYGYLAVYGEGVAVSTTVNSNGDLSVTSGGTAVSTTVNSGGYFSVRIDGIANSTTIKYAGFFSVSGGGIANIAMIDSGGDFYVFSGGTANNTTVNSGGRLRISSGGIANDTTVTSGGFLRVSSGGTANNTKINSGGSFIVSSGGLVNTTTVNSGGSFIISSGCVANSATVCSGGWLNVSGGGTANNTKINSGAWLTVSSGGTASILFNPWQGIATIDSRAGAEVNFLEREANVYYGDENVIVSKANVLESLNLESGKEAIVYSGGVVKNAAVSDRAGLFVSFGGMLSSVAVSSGGKVAGYFDCRNISFSPGAILDFDLSCYDTGRSDALVRNLSSVRSNTVFTLTVGNSLQEGTYKLADGVSEFDHTLSIMNSDVTIGSLTLDQAVKYNGKDYSLSLNNGDLVLSVVAEESEYQYVYLDFDGESNALYYNPDLNLSVSVIVYDPDFSRNQRQTILSLLSEQYAGTDVVFTLERPVEHEYSTLYFGKSGAFENYGGFFGISETHDNNNRNKSDNAFVLLDQSYSDDQIISVTSHMLDHLLGFSCLADESAGLARYAEMEYLLSTRWNQTSPYNKYCPIDPSTGSRSLTGCTNTAAAQLINYWIERGVLDFTLELEQSDSYTSNRVMIDDSSSPAAGYLSFAETNDLLANYEVGNEDSIAALNFAAGVVQHASYSSTSTSTAWNKKLLIRSGFENTVVSVYDDDLMSDPNIVASIKQELLQGRPVGISVETPNHALIIDGYDSSSNMFHLNFGWGGRDNRWYTLKEINEMVVDHVLTGIVPISSPSLSVNDLLADVNSVGVNEAVTLSFTVANAGKEKSESAMAYVYCGNVLLGGAELKYISPGASRDLNFVVNSASLLPGDNVLTVKVDSQEDQERVSSASLTVFYDNSHLPPAEDKLFFAGDFNGDLSDTLAVQSGNSVTVYMNGEPWGLGVTLEDGWSVVGTGDFSGDGLDDFLRVNGEGYVVGEMSNGNGTFSPQVLNLKTAGWDILGTGDFNGNGTDDVLIANPTGASETVGLLGYWESGVTWTLINGYSPEWECVSTGDYNGDGKCDMLWKNSFEGDGDLIYNAYCTWIADPPDGLSDWRMVSVANPDEWNFLCSGDFDGDKMNDIAMINNVGVVGIWGVSDGWLSSWSILSAVTSEWQLAGVADFNADGTDDIAWSNIETGLTGYWQINDKALTAWANIAAL